MVLADHVYRDVGGKYIICGTFAKYLIQVPADPQTGPSSLGDRQRITGPIARAGTPYLYLALVEVHGDVPLQLKFVDLADARVLFEADIVVTCSDPIAVAEYIFPMPPNIVCGKAGNYSLDLLYEDEILGQWRIAAVLIPKGEQ